MDGMRRSTQPASHLPSRPFSSPSLPDARNYLLTLVVTGDIMAMPKRSTSWVNRHLPAC